MILTQKVLHKLLIKTETWTFYGKAISLPVPVSAVCFPVNIQFEKRHPMCIFITIGEKLKWYVWETTWKQILHVFTCRMILDKNYIKLYFFYLQNIDVISLGSYVTISSVTSLSIKLMKIPSFRLLPSQIFLFQLYKVHIKTKSASHTTETRIPHTLYVTGM